MTQNKKEVTEFPKINVNAENSRIALQRRKKRYVLGRNGAMIPYPGKTINLIDYNKAYFEKLRMTNASVLLRPFHQESISSIIYRMEKR